MAKKRQTRRRSGTYVNLPFTIREDKAKKLKKIAKRSFPNRSAAIEHGVDLLIEEQE